MVPFMKHVVVLLKYHSILHATGLLKGKEGRKGERNKRRHINGMGKEHDGNDTYIIFP
jgi:hypothetical protein